MDRLLSLKVRWKRQENKAFGSGVTFMSCRWRAGTDTRNSSTLNLYQLAVLPVKATQLQHRTSLHTFPSYHSEAQADKIIFDFAKLELSNNNMSYLMYFRNSAKNTYDCN